MIDLSPETVSQIKAAVARGTAWAAIAKRLGVSPRVIEAVLEGRFRTVTLNPPSIQEQSEELAEHERCPRCGVLVKIVPPSGWPCWECRARMWKDRNG